MALHADGPNSRAAASMGDTERLVQVQVANISTNLTRRAQANLSIHVGAVHVDLPAVFVDNLADLLDLGLKDSIRAGVGNHHCAKLGGMLLALLSQIDQIQITRLCVALYGDHPHTGHGGRRRVGAVCRDRN